MATRAGRVGAAALAALVVASVVVGIPVFPGIPKPPEARAAVSGSTSRLSVTSSGAQASGSQPAVSADGRWVAFVSASSSLGVSNGKSQVFLRDTQANTTTLVSANTSGQPGNDHSGNPAVTSNGRYIFFDSAATDLIGGDTNGHRDVFVRDTTAGVTTRVSVGPGGVAGNGDSSNPSMAPTATASSGKVVFTSTATNFGGQCNGTDCSGSSQDVFVRDLGAGTTTLVSWETPNVSGYNNATNVYYPQFLDARTSRQAISADGRYVTFSGDWGSGAFHIDGCTGTYEIAEVWVYDFTTGQTTPLTAGNSNPPNALGCYTQASGGDHNRPSISPDGSTVAFVQRDNAMTFRSPTGALLATIPLPADAPVADPNLSTNGTRAAFSSAATGLVAGDTNGREDVFVVDRYGVGAIRVSLRNDGSQAVTYPTGSAAGSFAPAVQGDGLGVVFTSWASDLVASDTNNDYDVFARSGLPAVATAPTPGQVRGGANPGAPCSCELSPLLNATRHPIDTSTGNFWHTFEDFTIPGRGEALHLTHTYNSSAAAEDGPLGFGWTFSYNLSLAIGSGASTVTVNQENGAQIPYALVGSGYVADPRYPDTLVHNADGTWTFTRLARDIFTFDATGRLTSERDLNGYVTSVTRPNGSTMVVTDPAGRTLTFAYTGAHVTSVTDTASPARTVSFAYDGSGNLTDVTDVGGGVTHFTYDASHRLLTMLDPDQAGAATPVPVTNHYDAQGRVDWQKDYLGRQTSFDYTSIPGATKITDPKNNVVVEQYANGVVTSVTKGYGTAQAATWKMYWDAQTSRLAAETDPDNHTSRWTFDDRGNVLTATDGLGRTTVSTYNALNQRTNLTDPKGVTTAWTYDGNGNLQSVSTPWVEGTGNQVTTYTYVDSAHPGDVTSMTDPNQKVWSYTYDSAGNLSTATDPVTPTHGTTRFCYDSVGHQTATIAPKGTAAGVTCSTAAGAFTSYTTYNAFGDVKTVTDPLGHQSVKTYDADRNLKTAKDPDNNLTTYTYDSAGELTDVARADGTHLRYDYWPDGSLNHAYDGANQATTYAYDPLGRLQTETDPNGRATTYGYDPAGNRTTMQQPGGTCGVSPKTGCVTYVYDAADQLTSVTYSDTPAANVSSIGYDADGQRTSMTDGSGTSSWMWDSLHRMTQSSVGGQVTGYAYKLGGELTQIVYPGQTGAVNRTYDEAGHLLTVTDWAGRQTQFTYDADGFTTSEADPSANGVTTTFTPDGADRLMGITHAKGGATVASFSYGRDNADQVNSVTSTGVPADNHSYSYTQLNQLKNVDASAYGYSNADNLTTLTSGATMGYDSANQATSLVSGAGTVTIGYDNRGDRKSATTRSGGTTYAYDQANRLTSADPTDVSTSLAAGWYHSLVAKADGTVWAFGYNAYGQLGNNSTTDSSTPAQVPGLTGVVAVAAGAYHSVALRADGTVWTWGANGSGQLGNNSTVDSHVPVQVQGLTDVVAIAAGTLHTLALRADGTVWAWGHDANGQLGNNSTTNSPVPVLVQGLTNVVAVAGGYAHSVALRADGTVWGWGYNGYGQLGNNTTTDSLVAVQVPGLAGVAGIASGFFHTMALKAADGSVWGWGYNGHGQLGNNSTVDSHVPVAASGLTNVAGVRAGEYSSAAVKPDATTAAWGYNAYGQLGTGTTTDVSVPTAVGGLSTVRGLSPGAVTTLAAKTDGTVWAWGYNGFGEVGDGTTTTPRPSPQAVPNLSRGSATLAAYAYRGDGLRASKTVAGQTRAMAWDESASVPTLLSDGDRTYVYGPGGRPIEQVDAAGAVTYLHQDQDGSTRLLTNASGAVVATYTYDPYGRLAASTGSVSTPLRYAGEYTDAETGFVYLRARYYDPATGQFISRDPLTAMTGTPYSYVDNNPLNDTDPNGLLGWSDLRRLARGALHNSLVRYAIEAGGAAAFCAGTGGLGCTIIAGALIGAGLRVADRAINGCPTDGWGLVKAGFRGGIEGGVAGLLEGSAEGRELKISDDLRIAPGGNRGGEELPHYHRRVIDPLTGETEPGQGIGRHRPWQTKSPDTSFWDRF